MPDVELISSAANPLVKDVRSALSRGTLTERGHCVGESFHLLNEALRSDCEIAAVLASQAVRESVEKLLGNRSLRLVILTQSLFSKIAGTESSQGVMVLVHPRSWALSEVLHAKATVMILDGIQDPGNAGAILRAAEAFGGTGVVFLTGCVSPFNPKALRASAGSAFRVPVVQKADPAGVSDAIARSRLPVYAAVPGDRHGEWVTQADLAGPCGLVIGSEGRGVSPEMRAIARTITIPTARVESLNAALAAGILLYEAQRQRTHQP